MPETQTTETERRVAGVETIDSTEGTGAAATEGEGWSEGWTSDWAGNVEAVYEQGDSSEVLSAMAETNWSVDNTKLPDAEIVYDGSWRTDGSKMSPTGKRNLEGARQILEQQNVAEAATELAPQAESTEDQELRNKATALVEQRQSTIEALNYVRDREKTGKGRAQINEMGKIVRDGEMSSLDAQAVRDELQVGVGLAQKDLSEATSKLRIAMDELTSHTTAANAENLQGGKQLTDEQRVDQREQYLKLRTAQGEVDKARAAVVAAEQRVADLKELAENTNGLLELQELAKDNPEMVAEIEAEMVAEEGGETVDDGVEAANEGVGDEERELVEEGDINASSSEVEQPEESQELDPLFEMVRHLEDLSIPELEAEIERTENFIELGRLFVDTLVDTADTLGEQADELSSLGETLKDLVPAETMENIQRRAEALREKQQEIEARVAVVESLILVAEKYKEQVQEVLAAKQEERKINARAESWVDFAASMFGSTNQESLSKLMEAVKAKPPKSFIEVLFLAMGLLKPGKE
ncbi:hypothetical protein KC614_00410 [candidate division WWE3 bacterium]|uniref:Uncharacterized protein n=1 Tax=candidate division WWE3 bacterium TaxID=2053526 RepID=A0A955LJU0_UNCKA|nr:hypothetical protein [candidate division WWE3 bacterium]